MRTTGAEPLHLILVESALELVPREIWHHELVKKHARKRGKKPWETILDKSIHYRAMLRLPQHHKRGRPDIVHACLLQALGSPLNKVGLLRIYVHTIDNRVIFVDPSTRIPRHYYRFVGLMEQLLVEGRVPPNSDKPLMRCERMLLEDLLKELGVSRAILMHEGGSRISVAELGRDIASGMRRGERIGVLVGAFPHGSFSSDVERLASDKLSIFDQVLDSWVVVARVLAGVEIALGVC
ncbi:MAG: 16S rRNA methyltransferase [Crenarchaeota archaeon]|nr:16S rRNA methyltransferase [Thermoproteota archaeon]